MKLYHLTTKRSAKIIIETGIMMPGTFCDEEFYGVFVSRNPEFDWIERDVIIGHPHAGVVIEFELPDSTRLIRDPDAQYYGDWWYLPTREPICVTAKIIEDEWL